MQQKDIQQFTATVDQGVKAFERNREARRQVIATAFGWQEQQREQLRRDFQCEIQEAAEGSCDAY